MMSVWIGSLYFLNSQTYVQDLLVGVGSEVYRQVVEQKGHFYVCGDCTMAECVYQKLKSIVQEHGRLSDQEVENFMLQMRVYIG